MRALFGAEAAPGSGREELTISAIAVVASLHRAFRAAGIDDAVSLSVDGKVVWTDPYDRPDDLERMWAHVRELGVLNRPFDLVSLLLARRWQGVFLLFDLRLSRTVVLGDAEMIVEVYGRPDVSPQPGDTPAEAWERAYDWFADPDALDRARVLLAAQVQALREALAGAIPDCVIRVTATQVVLVRPSAEEISALVGTAWPWASSGRWQLGVNPAEPRPPDPFSALWHDAGFTLTRAAAIRALVEQPDASSRRAGVIVVDVTGAPLFDGNHADAHADDPWAGRWLHLDAAGVHVGFAPSDGEDAPTATPSGRRRPQRRPAELTWSPPEEEDEPIVSKKPAPAESTDDPSTLEATFDPPTVETLDDWSDLLEVSSEIKHSVKTETSPNVADDVDDE